MKVELQNRTLQMSLIGDVLYCCKEMKDAWGKELIQVNRIQVRLQIVFRDDFRLSISFCPFCGASVKTYVLGL